MNSTDIRTKSLHSSQRNKRGASLRTGMKGEDQMLALAVTEGYIHIYYLSVTWSQVHQVEGIHLSK